MAVLEPGYRVTSDIVLARRLGAGGMGTVWVADHAKLQIEVVVKFLSDSLVADPEARARFSREVTAALQVRSPHVVQTLDHGITEEGTPYIVMELLEGADLGKTMRQRKGQMQPHEAMHIVEGIASALVKAHDRGIVHRDIKPANVFLVSGTPKPFVKLVDFGIAKRLEDDTLTQSNAMLGTPAYMSPEQLHGSRSLDHRTDLWSLGVLTFFMLTGQAPFRGASFANVAQAILNGGIPSACELNPSLPEAIDAWMAKALARDALERFFSAREMADALAVALGELAFSTTDRRAAVTGPVPIPIAAPSGPPPPSVPSDIASDAIVVRQTPHGPIMMAPSSAAQFSEIGTDPTMVPATLTTYTSYLSSPRGRWSIAAMAVGGVALVILAFRLGTATRKANAFDAPPLATVASTAVPVVGVPQAAPPAATPPASTPTIATTSTPRPAASPQASSPSSTTARKSGGHRPAAGTTQKRASRPGEDDVGF